MVLDEHDIAVAELLADEPVYVTDGHHAPQHRGSMERDEPAFQRTLAVLFPSDALRAEAFHRRISDTLGRDPHALEALLADAGDLTEVGTLEEARPSSLAVGVYQGNGGSSCCPSPRPTARSACSTSNCSART